MVIERQHISLNDCKGIMPWWCSELVCSEEGLGRRGLVGNEISRDMCLVSISNRD